MTWVFITGIYRGFCDIWCGSRPTEIFNIHRGSDITRDYYHFFFISALHYSISINKGRPFKKFTITLQNVTRALSHFRFLQWFLPQSAPAWPINRRLTVEVLVLKNRWIFLGQVDQVVSLHLLSWAFLTFLFLALNLLFLHLHNETFILLCQGLG